MESFLLFDINGRQQSVEIIMNSKSLVINTANLPQGFYICKTALSNGTIAVNKLLINN
ncbi:MAG: T9SS type A sorting domain-containing protein [Bacteroidia bacterium]|jgi:saccharopine dehydrogenase-like NADP-dependent oxidoreductase|nr:T9SS type A sorting domain-containing protein [Bacteroidia bacterium]